jgi:hypothetical protein
MGSWALRAQRRLKAVNTKLKSKKKGNSSLRVQGDRLAIWRVHDGHERIASD